MGDHCKFRTVIAASNIYGKLRSAARSLDGRPARGTLRLEDRFWAAALGDRRLERRRGSESE